MLPQDMRIVCLQKYPEYYEDTITLLNNQWPRSRTARMRSLEQGSQTSLPTSLILLLKDDSGKEKVAAHSKISPVPYQPLLCFVESVVVSPDQRGKGLGRLIMNKTEEYVKSLGITTVYLTTFDQQGFYSKLGYEECDPIVVFGGSMKLVERADAFKVFSITHDKKASANETDNGYRDDTCSMNSKNSSTPQSHLRPAPPPPPPPPSHINNQHICNNNVVLPSKVTMKKNIQNT